MASCHHPPQSFPRLLIPFPPHIPGPLASKGVPGTACCLAWACPSFPRQVASWRKKPEPFPRQVALWRKRLLPAQLQGCWQTSGGNPGNLLRHHYPPSLASLIPFPFSRVGVLGCHPFPRILCLPPPIAALGCFSKHSTDNSSRLRPCLSFLKSPAVSFAAMGFRDWGSLPSFLICVKTQLILSTFKFTHTLPECFPLLRSGWSVTRDNRAALRGWECISPVGSALSREVQRDGLQETLPIRSLVPTQLICTHVRDHSIMLFQALEDHPHINIGFAVVPCTSSACHLFQDSKQNLSKLLQLKPKEAEMHMLIWSSWDHVSGSKINR